MRLKDAERRKQEIIASQRRILNLLEKENRDFRPEELEVYERMDREWERLDTLQKAAESREFNAPHASSDLLYYDTAIGESRRGQRGDAEYRGLGMAFAGSSQEEIRAVAMQQDLDYKGGYLTASVAVEADVIAEMDKVEMYSLGRKFTVRKAESVGIPVVETDFSDAAFTGEIDEASLDESIALGRRQLFPHRLTKAVKYSRRIEETSVPDFGRFISQRLSYKLSTAAENSMLTGSGASECLGLFTTSGQGIGADRNVSTGNTTTQIKSDNLIETLYNLKSQYIRSPKCRWVFHRDALKQIRKLKDGEGNYLWTPGIGQDRPSTILGIPYILSEFAPNKFTTGLRVGCIGDFNFFGIAEGSDIKFQVLTEKYALEDCNAAIIQQYIDAMPLYQNAFSMVTLS